MSIREYLFAVLVFCACALVAYGAYEIAEPVGLIVAGFLLGGWSWLVLAEVGK